MLHSELTKSTAVGVNAACPHEDLAPLMDMIDIGGERKIVGILAST